MITIDTKATGETTLFIAANSIMAAIHTLDRARAALVALDDQELPPISAEAVQTLIALRSEAIARERGAPWAGCEPIIEDRVPSGTQHLAQEPTAEPIVKDAPPPLAQEPTTQESAPEIPIDLPLESDDPNAPPTAEELRPEITATGTRLFGKEWDAAHFWLVQIWTNHYTPTNIRTTIEQLNAEECMSILEGLINRSQDTLAHWRKYQREQEATKAKQATTPAPHRGRQPRAAQPNANGASLPGAPRARF